jgi:hypothetical protein
MQDRKQQEIDRLIQSLLINNGDQERLCRQDNDEKQNETTKNNIT